MSRPVFATISGTSLQQNLSVVRRLAPNSRIWSVVKSNGYGHGLKHIWPFLTETDGFALLTLEEASLLRDAGCQKPILLLEGFFHPSDLALLDHYRLTTTIHSDWQIQALAKAELYSPLDVYLKINTGMNRLGFAPERLSEIWDRLRSLKNISRVTLMTHFAEAEKHEGVREPLEAIENVIRETRRTKPRNHDNILTKNIRPRREKEGYLAVCPRSFANSAALLWHPNTHFDWVRPGIILYGASPTGIWKDITEFGLKPVMTLNSKIIAVQNLSAGDSLGYGRTYIASSEQRVGVVACGYADGYPRHAPTGTPILVDGVRTRTLGMLSMDMLTVDLTPCPQASLGSLVELWGKEIKIDDVAASAGTTGYELMCALASRVPIQVC